MVKIIKKQEVIVTTHTELVFDVLGDDGKPNGRLYSFKCDAAGNVDLDSLTPAGLDDYWLCALGGHNVGKGWVRTWTERHTVPAAARCDECGGEAEMDRNCGAWVCRQCGNHVGLSRCFCGWSQSGGDGYRELEEMGETIEPEDY